MAFWGLLAAGAAKGAIKGIQGARAAKEDARNQQKAAQYQVNQEQKGLNKKYLNFASLLRALKREGWYGDAVDASGKATGPGFMQDYGYYDPNNFRLDDVPRASTGGVLSSALLGAGSGAAQAYEQYMYTPPAAPPVPKKY